MANMNQAFAERLSEFNTSYCMDVPSMVQTHDFIPTKTNATITETTEATLIREAFPVIISPLAVILMILPYLQELDVLLFGRMNH